MSATFASLRYVNYRYWFAATLIASTGTWLQRVAQDWYVLTVLTDHDSSQVGIVTALQFLPIILFSAWAGVLADVSRGGVSCSARRLASALSLSSWVSSS